MVCESEQCTNKPPVRDNGWKIDKHIPVAVILTIAIQTFAGVWWIAGVQHTVQDHERRLTVQESNKLDERMAVLEVQLKASHEAQLEVSAKLDRLLNMNSKKSGGGDFEPANN